MPDSLKSMVMFANALFVACITVAAFLVSPVDTAAPYSKAHEELTSLNELGSLVRDYRKEVGDRIERIQLPELIQAMMVDRGLPNNWDGVSCEAAPPPAAAPAVKEVPGPGIEPKANKQRKNDSDLDASEGNRAASGSKTLLPIPDPQFTTASAVKSVGSLDNQLALADDFGPHVVAFQDRAAPAPAPEAAPAARAPAALAPVRYAALGERCLRSWRTSLPVTTIQPQIEGTLAQIHEFFTAAPPLEDHSDPHAPVIFFPDVCGFTHAFRGLLARHSDATAVEWWIEAPGQPALDIERGMKVCKGCAGPAPAMAMPVAVLTVRFLHKNDKSDGMLECTTIGGSWGWPKCGVAQPLSFKKWARENPLLPKVRTEVDSSFVWFPKSRAIWSEIKDKGLEESILTVKGRHERESNRISLFGLSLNRTSATYSFPVVLAILFLLIWNHTVHLHNTLSTDADDRAKIVDGWFVLFPHRQSQWLGIGLLAVLPNVVLVWLLVPDHGVNVFTKIAVACVLAFLSWKTLTACLLLRGVLSPLPAKPNSSEGNTREMID